MKIPTSLIILLLLVSFGTAACAQDSAPDKKPQANGRLITKVYQVPQTFLSDLSGNGVYHEEVAVTDLFADPAGNPVPPNNKTASVQDQLTEAGIAFEKGTSASFDEKKSQLTVTNTAEQIEITEHLLDIIRSGGESQIFVYYEFIEVEHDIFSDWLFENVMDNDGTELRNEVQKWIKAGKGEIIESATVATRSGQRAKVESIDEYIYPTEYDPAEIPNDLVLKNGAETPSTSTTPTAFETRNLGTTLEVDPVLGSDNKTIDLNLAPEIVKLEKIEQWHHKMEDPRFKTHMPTFYTMKITSQITLTDGRYGFLGTTRPLAAADPKRKNPIVLQFVRADVSSTKDWKVVD